MISTGRSPKVDLALVIRKLCETYWKEAGGKDERLTLHLDRHILNLDRIRWLSEAVRALLVGGLSPGFAPEMDGAMGVHLWSTNRPRQIILLIADSGKEENDEPSTPFITRARQYAERAGCSLIWQHARGAVWRIHIPEDDVQPRLGTARETQDGGLMALAAHPECPEPLDDQQAACGVSGAGEGMTPTVSKIRGFMCCHEADDARPRVRSSSAAPDRPPDASDARRG